MRRLRVVVVAAAAAAALSAAASCATSSPGHGTGAGAVPGSSATAPHSSSAPAPSSVASSTTSAPTSPSVARSSSHSAHPTGRPPSSHSSGSGQSTYTGRGGPNSWCGSSQLAVTGGNPPQGNAAGHTGVELRFLNNSHHRCILYGYPGADGTNGGRSIAHAARTPDGYLGGCHCSQLRGVLVGPGQSAYALVEGDIGGNGNCDRFSGLLVTPPNTYDSTPLQLAPHSCDFQVHPVTPTPS